MSIPGSANPLLLASAAPTSYQVQRSLRFNSADSAYLSRTPASAGNRKTWTFSWWMKRSALSTSAYYTILDALGGGSGTSNINIPDSNSGSGVLEITEYIGAYNYRLVTTQVFRDPSAWYHCVVAFDTTQATAADRIKLYVNGAQVTTFSTATYPSQNLDGGINSTNAHNIGRNISVASRFWDGYLAECIFVDGSALAPSSFGETNATTGQWVPKAFSGGSYGTNGFKLDFSNAATTSTVAQDVSGRDNHWTANNISVTAGRGNDALMDHPVSSGTDSGVGAEVRGNYCTWNPLSIPAGSGLLTSDGNLQARSNGVGTQVFGISGTLGSHSGKYYFEYDHSLTANSGGYTNYAYWGIGLINTVTGTSYTLLVSSGNFTSAFDGTYAVAFDLDSGKWWHRGLSGWGTGNPVEGTNPTRTFPVGTYVPYVYFYKPTNSTIDINCGQRRWLYTAPGGFKALCDTNLPAPLVAKGSSTFDVKLYTGNGSTQTISGLGFSPDLVWLKKRGGDAALRAHQLFDTIRGTNKALYSNLTDAEFTDTDALTAFNSDGFTLGAEAGINTLNDSLVAWCWDVGTAAASTNNSGTIQSTVKVNATSGFSIVTYTGNNTAGATIGHGLNAIPQFIITFKRGGGREHAVWHSGLSSSGTLYLANTYAAATYPSRFDVTGFTSSVFKIGSNTNTVNEVDNYVAYCWAPVSGYSSFGSYVGNGSTDGPFVYTGFRPRWVMFKRSDSTSDWIIYDTSRDTYNVMGKPLYPSLSNAEADSPPRVDYLSNGFKLRVGGASEPNWSGSTVIYAAFAESPFQYARAR